MYLLFFRSSDECNKKQPSDCDTLEYRNGEGKKCKESKFVISPFICACDYSADYYILGFA